MAAGNRKFNVEILVTVVTADLSPERRLLCNFRYRYRRTLKACASIFGIRPVYIYKVVCSSSTRYAADGQLIRTPTVTLWRKCYYLSRQKMYCELCMQDHDTRCFARDRIVDSACIR